MVAPGYQSSVRKYSSELRAPFPKCNILGVDIAATNNEECASYLIENIHELSGQYICFSNVHTTVMSNEDETYRKAQNSSLLSVPDGSPLAKTALARGYSHTKRMAAGDFMDIVFKTSEQNGMRHFFYGSKPETIKLLKKALKASYPKLQISGMYSPPFKALTPEEDAEHVRMINASNSDFVWVGLGAPKQERWMLEHKGRVDGLMLGVGACFDYFAGNIKRAPQWMQDASLEWLYRLMQEPRRLFGRYMSTNWKFIRMVAKENKGWKTGSSLEERNVG